MKVPNNDQIAFLKKIIEKTKTGEIHWSTMSYEHSSFVFPYESLDQEGGFQCEFYPGGMFFLVMRKDGLILGKVGVDLNHTESLNIDDESISVLMLRLFNLISEFKPNARKLVEDFLAHE